MAIVRASSKGQIVLPKAIREKLGIKPGKKLALQLVGNRIEISPLPEDPIEHLCGIFQDHSGSLADDLLTERRKDKKRDAEKVARFTRGARVSQGRKRRQQG